MKKALLLGALASSLVLAVAPDFSDIHTSAFNKDATGAQMTTNDDLVNIQKYVEKENNYPDTIYLKSFDSLSGPEDTIDYFITFNFFESENYYTRTMHFPNFFGEGFVEPYVSKISYNNQGLTTSCSTFVDFMEQKDTSVSEYHYDENDLLVKRIKTAESGTYIEADSVTYVYLGGSSLPATSTEYLDTDTEQAEKTVCSYSYDNERVTEIRYIKYNADDVITERSALSFTLKESPILKESNMAKGSSQRITLEQGRLGNLENAAHAECQLLSASGRVLKELSLNSTGNIIQWNSIPNGYYLLRVRQNSSVVTLPFVK